MARLVPIGTSGQLIRRGVALERFFGGAVDGRCGGGFVVSNGEDLK
jgi:hypothetical protein